MSWMQDLAETYENCKAMVGARLDENEIPLLPICHTTQKAQIEITLDEDGNFRRARVIPKDESRTIIPSTEKSAGRTSGEAAHPLCDKLQYIALDYVKFGGEKDSYYQSYFDLLANWTKNGAPKRVWLIYKYIKQGRVIADLVSHKILFADKKNKLFKQRPKDKELKNKLDIFDLLPGRTDPKNGKLTSWQAEAFVRWTVEISNSPQSAVWNDPEIIQSWIDYYTSTKEIKALCYITGEDSFSADQHPAKIRNDGDKAKIISSNDLQGYTFRGRFIYANQAATVGFKTTQRAHFALRWLIGHQGYNRYGLAIVAWATSGAPVPQPTDDPQVLLWGNAPMEEDPYAYTAQELGIKLKNRIAGYGKEFKDTEKVVVMAVDSAVPGRLAITYYHNLAGSDFLQKINDWHTTSQWLHHYGVVYDNQSENYRKDIRFIGAPAPADIAEVAYGYRVDDKLRKATILRLLPCIIDGQPIPRDLVEAAVRRASNRIALEKWQWNKTLSIACSLYKKFKQGKEKYDMSLDENRKTRDYLYGRLLAIADVLEERVLFKAEQNRPTNAARYMQHFSQRPFHTWKQIHDLLTPYMLRLGSKAYFYKNLISDVEGAFTIEDFLDPKPLTGEYLLGFYCQRQKLWEKAEKSVSTASDAADDVTNQ